MEYSDAETTRNLPMSIRSRETHGLFSFDCWTPSSQFKRRLGAEALPHFADPRRRRGLIAAGAPAFARP